MATNTLPEPVRPANPLVLPRHIRAAITGELTMLFDRVDLLLARLDAAEVDPDFEEDDHSGDPLDLNGEAPDDEGRGIYATRPLYGIDQTTGPVNEVEAGLAHHAAENGLVRSVTGGWKRAA